MKIRPILLAGAGALALASVSAALEQPAPAPAEADTGLEEITVTAQRRSQKLQDVPVAVTAITAVQLERQQVVDIKAIQYATPSFTLAPHPGDPTSIGLGLRGVRQADSLLTLDPAVGVYLDGVYLARSAGGNLNLIDMERVEVLRGPQGTLFGRNTTGGALNLVSRSPSDTFEGWLKADVGNFDLYALTGVANVPLADGLAFRLAAQHTEHSGYGRNTFLNRDLADDNTDFVRATLKWDINDDWTVQLQGDWTSRDSNEQMTRVVYAAQPPLASAGTLGLLPLVCAGTAPVPALNALAPLCAVHDGSTVGSYVTRGDFYDSMGDQTGQLKVTSKGVSATITGELGFGTFKSITAWRSLKRDSGTDLDGTPYVLLGQTAPIPQHVEQDQFSQEFQLYGEGMDGRFDWIVGAIYFEESGRDDSSNRGFFPLNQNTTFVRGRVENSSRGVFAQFTYEFVPDLKLTAGVRYTEDKRFLFSQNSTANIGLTVISCQAAPALLDNPGLPASDPRACNVTLPELEFSYMPFTVGLDYRVNEDVLVYAKFARGFRSGGYNLRGGSAVVAFDPFFPEQLDSYELGIKSELFDKTVRLNAAIYHSDFTDIQLSTPTASGAGQVSTVIRNSGTATIEGGELEISAVLFEQLQLNASVGYVESGFDTGPTVGVPFVMIPSWTYSLGADLPFDFEAGSLNFHLDWAWRSKTFTGQGATASVPVSAAFPNGTTTLAQAYIEDYGILNGVVSFEMNNGVSVSLWGRNLLEEEYYSSKLDLVSAGLGIITGFQGDPRTFGLSLKYEFGG